MRFVTALLLLVSVLTTHSVALERAAEKALTCTEVAMDAGVASAASDVLPIMASGGPVIDAAEAASDIPEGPCHGHGDCVFLMPQHRLATSVLVPAEAGERRHHASVHHGRLENKPPIA